MFTRRTLSRVLPKRKGHMSPSAELHKSLPAHDFRDVKLHTRFFIGHADVLQRNFADVSRLQSSDATGKRQSSRMLQRQRLAFDWGFLATSSFLSASLWSYRVTCSILSLSCPSLAMCTSTIAVITNFTYCWSSCHTKFQCLNDFLLSSIVAALLLSANSMVLFSAVPRVSCSLGWTRADESVLLCCTVGGRPRGSWLRQGTFQFPFFGPETQDVCRPL